MTAHDDFIATMLPSARKSEAQFGFAAEGLIAINVSETNWGAAGSLFGIKGSGTAGSINYQTWENYGQGAEHTVIDDAFAAYKTVDDAYADFFRFIQIGRYLPAWNAFQQTGDWRELLHGINRAGYATDPNWASMIIALSETVKASPAFKEAAMPDQPTVDTQVLALVALAHFIRNGWNLADLSPQDKAAIKAAAEKVPA